MLYTKYLRPPKEDFLEGPFEQSIVETFGHETMNEKVQRLMNAGVALEISKVNFEFAGDEDVPEDYFDITREPGFDVFEAHRLLKELREKRMGKPTTRSSKRAKAKEEEEGTDVEEKEGEGTEPVPSDEKVVPAPVTSAV